MKDFKYPVLRNRAILNCVECGARASVLAIYGEHEEPLCSDCYVKTLPAAKITLTDGECDLTGGVVGCAYYIAECNYPAFEPYEWGFYNLKHLRDIADSITCVGEKEIKGKRSKQLKVTLKPEYRELKAARLFDRLFTPTQLSRTITSTMRLRKEYENV